jgi:hypothetical protein
MRQKTALFMVLERLGLARHLPHDRARDGGIELGGRSRQGPRERPRECRFPSLKIVTSVEFDVDHTVALLEQNLPKSLDGLNLRFDLQNFFPVADVFLVFPLANVQVEFSGYPNGGYSKRFDEPAVAPPKGA